MRRLRVEKRLTRTLDAGAIHMTQPAVLDLPSAGLRPGPMSYDK